MKADNLQPLSGFRDVLDSTKGWAVNQLRQVFELYGYQALETPALERQEILLGKLGEEGQKQLYLFEDNGKRPVGLRYDLTVPLARFVANNLGSLPLPFKRYEIGSSWRAEKPQKGRYRQFTQADVDIISAPEPASELELLSVVAFACEKLDLSLTCQVNDRRIVTAVLDTLKVPADTRSNLLQLFDKRDKLTEEAFTTQFNELGLSDIQRRQLSSYFLEDTDNALERFKELLGDATLLATVKAVLAWAKARAMKAVFVPGMVRGLDYYTGTIFEFTASDYDGGTVVAGGRYDSLIESLTGEQVPAVGLSFGVDRLTDLLQDKGQQKALFVTRLPETSAEVSAWVRQLRQNGVSVEVYLDEATEVGKQFKYAIKRGFSSIIIPRQELWKEGKVAVKNFETGQQTEVSRDDIVKHG